VTTQQPRRLDTDDMRDALAYMRATVLGDTTGRMAIAQNCDAPRMLDCLAAYALGLAEQAVDGGPLAWLDMLTLIADTCFRLDVFSFDFRIFP
jgi:hypothetical protein